MAVPHESLWGRWNKLELFNRATRAEIREYLLDPEAIRERTWRRSADLGDSRVQGGLDGEKLAALSAPGSARTLGVIGDYFPETEKSRDERDLWADAELRYCPDCLKAGVHVTYFQFFFVERCPVHGAKLRTRCPSCRTSIAYRHGWQGAGWKFACNCRQPLWNWRTNPVSSVSSKLKRGHADAGAWILAATRLGQMLHYPLKYETRHTLETRPNPIRPFATLVAHAHPELGRLTANFSSRFEKRITTSRINGGGGRATCERWRLVATYKSICRYYRRRLLRHHRTAMKEITMGGCRPVCSSYGELHWRTPFAPAASAFIAWRMYWEGSESPAELDELRKKFIPLERKGREREHWTLTLQRRFYRLVSSPQSKAHRRVSIEVKVRWFAEVCMRVFDECLVRIYRQFQHKAPNDGARHWYFTTKWIDGALIPLMLPRMEKDGSVTLFWMPPYHRTIEFPFIAKAIQEAPTKSEFEANQRALSLFIERIYGSSPWNACSETIE